MILYKKIDRVWVLLLVLLKIRFHNAQEVNNTNGNQGAGVSSVDARFYDPNGRGMGYPNLREPGRFGNSPNNYPGNPFFPYGNQNGQSPQQGWNPNSQNPNQFDFQGRPYQRPGGGYPGNQGDFPYGGGPNNFRPGPNNGFFNPSNMNQNPGYQQPPYNSPGDRIVYPGNINGPYGNGQMPGQGPYFNQPMQPGPYPSQNGQFYPQQNFPSNQNNRPSSPDDLTNVIFPGNINGPNQPGQYPQGGFGQQGNFNIDPTENNHFQTYPSNNNPVNNVQYPGNTPGGNDGSIQFPNQGALNQGSNLPGSNQILPGNFNGAPQTKPQLPNNQQIGSINGPNANDTAAILGKPVFVPSSTASPQSPGQASADGSVETPAQRQCVQDCPSTTEYNPVCGTNNVTYINPGRFYCARNCGENVNIQQMGRCANDIQVM
ncbi:uncharacterized protein LOC142975482 [Anticarsia gemmatalis]|uniref:uncharacterized protein LOC142975482 n=1 Tax=Anticarsia gemmatalis TaxID=129554 RepID=UPI003F76E8AF